MYCYLEHRRLKIIVNNCGFKDSFCFFLQFSHSWYMKNLEQGTHSSELITLSSGEVLTKPTMLSTG